MKKKAIEIDYRDDGKHIQKRGGFLEVRLSKFPKGFIGTIEQEFIEMDERPGEFEEFIFKEIEEDDR